jgi:CO/xanthine dehydrogenase Mo-binding subunit
MWPRITLVTADTARTPDEGYTAGSNSMKDSGTAIVNAAAQVRALLVEEAAKKWNVAPNTLGVKDGVVTAADGRRLEFRELVAGQALHVRASAQSVRAKTRNVIGKPVPRVDIPAKVTGGVAYIQDLRLPGMVHARVVRPPQYGAKLVSLDTSSAACRAASRRA